MDRSFVVSNATNVLMLIIAGFGIIVTLLASVLERAREIGILRSIGMKRSQVSGLGAFALRRTLGTGWSLPCAAGGKNQYRGGIEL